MKIKHYHITILLALFIAACTEDVNLPFDSTYTRLCVEGSITTDTIAHKVILSRSGDALGKDQIVYISNAKVSITDGTDTFKLTENSYKKGVYETQPNIYGVAGKTYTLNISNIDINGDDVLENYSAKSQLLFENPIDSIKTISQIYSERENGWLVKLYALDPGGRNYYIVKASKNGNLITDSISEYGITNNAGFEGKYYPGIGVYYFSNNKIDERILVGDTITLELDGITQDYFDFINGYKQEIGFKTPIFSGPSANVSTNIEPKNKAVGFFAAYSIQRKNCIFK